MLDSGYILDGKYEVVRTLGKGGMGVVYLCRNIRLGNFWAIKQVTKGAKNIDILTEANILKDLCHPGIRRIVDIFYENNNLYMVQDYIEGQTLKEYVKVEGQMETERVCKITSDLCDIISYLHNQNPAIIYRDIKPSNIMITTSGKVVLIDFGISKVYKIDTEQDTVCAGSNGYAAPEQYGLGKSCVQTDIYGIGMLVYFMINGKNPSTGIQPLLDEGYEDSIDEDLKAIIQKCVKIDIKDRYVSVEDLKKELLKVLSADKYEKTMMFSDANTSIEVFAKKVQIANKGKRRRLTRVTLCFIAAILASIYILYGNEKDHIDINTADRPEIIRPIVDSKGIEEDASVEPAVIPQEEDNIGISQDTAKNEKTSLVSKKGKAKGKEKKKR
jgi:serine/threonine protein kinase